MKYIFNITKEPKGVTYKKLLDFLSKKCSKFSFVMRDKLSFESSAYEMEKKLSPFLITWYESDRWPGTKLINGKAKIFVYEINEETIKILLGVNGLYSWLSPALPEDLVFYKSDGIEWLISISHEKDAYIQDEQLGTKEEIKFQIPELEIE